MSTRRIAGYVDQLVRRSIVLMMSVALNGPHKNAHSNVLAIGRNAVCLEEPVYLSVACVSREGI